MTNPYFLFSKNYPGYVIRTCKVKYWWRNLLSNYHLEFSRMGEWHFYDTFWKGEGHDMNSHAAPNPTIYIYLSCTCCCPRGQGSWGSSRLPRTPMLCTSARCYHARTMWVWAPPVPVLPSPTREAWYLCPTAGHSATHGYPVGVLWPWLALAGGNPVDDVPLSLIYCISSQQRAMQDSHSRIRTWVKV